MTKIGMALHVKFLLKDGSFRYVDCDLNIPTIPICTEYDGNIEEIGGFLLKERPVGWLEEKGKLEDMGAAGGSPHLQVDENWQVEFTSLCKGLYFVCTHFYNGRSRCG